MRGCFLLLLAGQCWTIQSTELIGYEGGRLSHDHHYHADHEKKPEFRTTGKPNHQETREHQSHFRFWTVITVVFVGMMTFVCVFSIIHMFKLIISCSYSGSASIQANAEVSENSYVIMTARVTQTSSSEHQENSGPPPLPRVPQLPDSRETRSRLNSQDTCSNAPETDKDTDTDSNYMDLNLCGYSNDYEQLRSDSLQESIYHTIELV